MSAVDIQEEPSGVDVDPEGESDSAATPPDTAPARDIATRDRRRPRPWRRRTIAAVLVIGTVVAGVAAAALFVKTQHARDRQGDTIAVVQAAREGAVSILSYQPATVDSDLAKATALLTGEFRNYYTKFTGDVVAPASKQKKIATTATVPAVGAVTVEGSKATVLVFVDQRTTSADSPQPADSASSVRVELVKEGGHWLIDKFDPV